MSDNRSRRNEYFAKYDSMTDEELEAFLRLDADAPEGKESDTEALLYIMGVLADRRKNSEVTGKTAQESFESFKRNYLNEEENTVTVPNKCRKKTGSMGWLRGLAAAAAVLAIVFLGSITVRAMGFDIWEAVVTWAQETFHFGSGEQGEPRSMDQTHYASLQDALELNKEAEGLVPTWIPDGYELGDIKIAENPMRRKYVALYMDGVQLLTISVQLYLDSYPEQIEQSDGYINTIEQNGVSYYFFQNNDMLQAAWINGSYECYISGELTIEQLTQMINSIEEG